MFSPLRLLRDLFGGPAPRPRASVRLGVEPLDERSLPSAAPFDLLMLSARLDTPTVVRFDYAAAGPATTVLVGVYRSADAVFDPSDQLVGGGAVATPAGFGVRSGAAGLFGELPLDPARDHVLVVADPFGSVGEFNEANNTAAFRKFAVAAVAHGFSVTGNPAEWLVPFAAAVQAEGYDFVLPFVWTPLSQLPTPDGTVTAGNALAGFMRFVGSLAGPNDVVDVHLIGHSRGTAVVSQAFQSLTLDPGPRALRLGSYRQTLLDPHVARNFGPLALGQAEVLAATGTAATSQVGQFSFDPSRPFSRAFALATLGFQEGAMDPPAFVPAAVDRVDVYFQRLPWDQATWKPADQPVTAEATVGVNFLAPPTPVANPFNRPITYTDLGPERVGHYEVPAWYLERVVPTLGG